MSRDWKAGDVIADEDGSVFFIVEVTANTRAAEHTAPGSSAVGADGNGWRVGSIEGARRLVVLDPENAEDMFRLACLMRKAMYPNADGVNIQASLTHALRELANPTPRIAEPTGVHAVVLDSNDNRWCHVGEGVWRSLTSTGPYVVEKHWHDLSTPLAATAVSVLFEGVKP